MRARTGALPADEIAITTGDRSTIDGIIKLDKSGESTTLTGIRNLCASLDTSAFTLESLVAEIITE